MSRRTLLPHVVFVASAMFFASTAHADEYATTSTTTTTTTTAHGDDYGPMTPPSPGLQFGARVAYGLGSGEVYKGFGVGEGSNGFVPITIDVGSRITPNFYIGGYGSWAYVIPKHNPTSCPDGFTCTVMDWRFGVQADWHFLPGMAFDPYVGLNAGWEILHNAVSGQTPIPTPGGVMMGDVSAHVTDSGPEWLGITVGGDIRLGNAVALGPYFTFSFGRYGARSGYTRVTINNTIVSDNQTADVEHAMHEIYMLGIRGTFNPL